MEITEELWDKTYALNVKSLLLCSQEVLKDMISRKSGKIINVSSAEQVKVSSMDHRKAL